MPEEKPRSRPGIGARGLGRRKGTPNRTTKLAREAIQMAFDRLGGVKALVEWARKSDDNLKIFYGSIYPRLLPVQVTGEDGTPLKVEVVQFSADSSNP